MCTALRGKRPSARMKEVKEREWGKEVKKVKERQRRNGVKGVKGVQ